MRIRSAIAVAALLPAALAFTVAVDTADVGDCRVDETRTAPVLDENGEPTTDADGNVIEAPVEYCEGQLWAQCPSTLTNEGAPQQADKVYLPVDGIPLDVVAPPGSFTEGYGCGMIDEPVFGNANFTAGLYHYFMSGKLRDAGNVDTLTLEVHFLGPNVGYTGQAIALDMRIEVDGVGLFGDEQVTNVQGEPQGTLPKERRVMATPIMSSTGASSSYIVTVTGIADLLEEKFAYESGQGSDNRDISIGLNFPHLDGPCAETPTNGTERCPPFGPSPLVMGADEIPTGVTLNKFVTDDVSILGDTTPAGDEDA